VDDTSADKFLKSRKHPKTLDGIREASKDLYDHSQGRIKGKSVVDKALKLAEKEVVLLEKDPQATLVDKNLAKIKLANALIAEDSDSNRGEAMLAEALNALDAAGYNPRLGEAPPVYIHGLYNRGAGHFNNRVYKDTRQNAGDDEMDLADANFEGLHLDMPITQSQANNIADQLKQDLPHLNKAITLSSGLQDRGLAQVEYLSSKGEILHTLSHLSESDTNGRQHDVDGLNTFHSALAKLADIPKMLYTPRHFKLTENLGTIKVPHMCSHQHRPADAKTQCKTLSQGSEVLMKDMLAHGIQPPELTMEEMDSDNVMENRFKLHIPIR